MAPSIAEKDATAIARRRQHCKGEDEYAFDERMEHPLPYVEIAMRLEYLCEMEIKIGLECQHQHQSQAHQSAGDGTQQCSIVPALPSIIGVQHVCAAGAKCMPPHKLI